MSHTENRFNHLFSAYTSQKTSQGNALRGFVFYIKRLLTAVSASAGAGFVYYCLQCLRSSAITQEINQSFTVSVSQLIHFHNSILILRLHLSVKKS